MVEHWHSWRGGGRVAYVNILKLSHRKHNSKVVFLSSYKICFDFAFGDFSSLTESVFVFSYLNLLHRFQHLDMSQELIASIYSSTTLRTFFPQFCL